jgi:RHH-type proline utilization regulon transcriptional repressor/proline dehydrogenase/delta 1-pyrroline-5-carboxylate dehydrogenase
MQKSDTKTNLLQEISRQAFLPEKQLIDRLIKKAAAFNENYHEDYIFGKKLVEKARKREGRVRVEGFLREFGLNTNEGVMIMCLAEALLRIPDAHTADQLIEDSFRKADWDKYLGKSSSLFVNASTWGLMLTGGIVHLGKEGPASVSGTLGKMVARLGEPVIREALKKAMQIVGNQFVMGETIEAAYKNAGSLRKEGFLLSFDMLGEAARSEAQAEQFFESYLHAVDFLSGKVDQKQELHERPSISVKLSALSPRYELAQEREVFLSLYPRLKTITSAAMEAGLALSIDAEESYRLDLSLKLFGQLLAEPDFRGFDGIGFVLQAYQKRAMPVLEYLTELAGKAGKQIPLRLVKGAYWDTEIKRAQELGLEGYPVFTRKSYTDVSYLACAFEMLRHERHIYSQFATHNALTIASILNFARGRTFEFQRLRGMGRDFYTGLLDRAPCRVYAPVGRHEDLLAYLIRRLLENGANTSFVNIMSDADKPLTEILANPIAKAAERRGAAHPNIPLPEQLFPERKNSHGLDLGNLAQMAAVQEILSNAAKKHTYFAAPLLAGSYREGASQNRYAPFNRKHKIGEVIWAGKSEAQEALCIAQRHQKAWDEAGVEARAECLERAANLLEERRADAISLIMLEAGRTFADALSEVREAIDFCRYYAFHARKIFSAHHHLPHITGEANTLELGGRGVFAAISPWNFPLSIFTGQVAAALVTGNSVVAKPAEQTPLTGAFMANLFLDSGVPGGVLQFLPGDGMIGSVLTAATETRGVVFTGSFETARAINRTLAEREGPITPFIAETGGQNCMIVDSTALPEQVVDDVVASFINSAGQRCSALRVLYVQKDIADKVVRLLSGAVAARKIGSPLILSSDVGPVIDEDARERIDTHITRMKKEAQTLYTGKVPRELMKEGYFIAPHIFEIGSIGELSGEVFGPVLHVIRYDAKNLGKVLDDINNTGFGLTLGIHTRVKDKALRIRSQLRVGNAYINRSQIGAVVGAHPFGGEGLSGTGPKAGGPHYLFRFIAERSTSINTAAIGGNLDLLS